MAYIAVSKSALLDWINSYFDLNYNKIEQCGNGAVYCMIFNSLYPNLINISRVKLNANSDFDILINYKLLQNGFNKVNISRDVNVEKLMKCRLQDNLEFLQWFGKLWCDHNKDFTFGNSSSQSSSRRTSSIGLNNSLSNQNQDQRLKSRSSSTTIKSRISSQPIKAKQSIRNSSNNINSIDNKDSLEISKLKKELKDTKDLLDEISNLNEGLEIERNFYFGKLREIEVICQNISQSNNSQQISTLSLIEDLKEIMYSTEEGFLLPDETDNNNIIIDNNDNNDSKNSEINNSILKTPKINQIQSKDNEKDLSEMEVNKTNDELFDDETF